MASTFGDQSYSKLPPIPKGSLKDSQDLQEEEKRNSSHVIGFNREGHGLVRLPPIIRVDSSVPCGSTLNTAKEKEIHEGYKGNTTSIVCSREDQDSFVASRRFSSDLSFTQSSYSDIHLNESRRKLGEDTTSESVEYMKDSHLVESDTRSCTISRLEIDTLDDHNLDHIKAPSNHSLLNTRQGDRGTRRASLITSEPQRLHRGRRLAKSSPDLSSTRKKYSSPIREPKSISKARTETEWIAASRSGSDTRSNEQVPFEISASVLDQGSPRSPRTGKGRGFARKTDSKHKVIMKGEFSPQSSPCTPVVQLINDEDDNLTTPREGRRSLGDINNIITPPRGRRISIVSTRKKLPIRDEIKNDGLRVDGKTCPKNERLTPRVAPSRPAHPSKDGFLRPPESKIKRDSIYDLQQILAMLNREDRSGNPSDSSRRENRSSSVYDLQEFLGMSSFSDRDPAGVYNKQNSNLNVQKLEAVESLAVPCVAEPENRRDSTYDLLEFLSLNFAAKNQENAERNNDIVNSMNLTPASSPFLRPKDNDNTSADLRRSSAYDLMEFLSLSRQNEDAACSDQDQSQPTPQPSLGLPTNSTEQGESRKKSIYDLEGFLGLTKSLPTASRASEAPVPRSPVNSFLSPNLPSNFKLKRDSIYDLQEFLGILQKEADVKRSFSQSEEKDSAASSTHPRNESKDDSDPESTSTRPAESLPSEPHKNRSLSIYDLREFLSMYATQSQSTTGNQSRRKASSISQSSIMINVSEDEFGNGSVDDVFLAVPVEGTLGRKRSSVSELNEILNVLNDPSRKRLHPNPSSAKSSSSDHSADGSPSPVSRHDSGGAKSLYDLGEFLSMLNTDDSPLRRRLSSVSDRGNRSPSALSRNDSSGGSSLYDLEEFLTILNDNSKGKDETETTEENIGQDICIPVPQLPSRSDRNGNERITLIKRRSLTAQSCVALNSVPESNKMNGEQSDGRRASLGHCL